MIGYLINHFNLYVNNLSAYLLILSMSKCPYVALTGVSNAGVVMLKNFCIPYSPLVDFNWIVPLAKLAVLFIVELKSY